MKLLVKRKKRIKDLVDSRSSAELRFVAEMSGQSENVVNRLSTLHSILYIAYRSPIKKWQVRGIKHKEIVENNNKEFSENLNQKCAY